MRGRSVFTNSVPAGHVRGPGGPQTSFAIESLIDELARRLSLDPFEIRRLNLLQAGDLAPRGKGVMGVSGLGATIDEAARYVADNMSERKPNQGVGVACGAWDMAPSRGASASKCIVKLNEDGSAVLLTGLADNGGGQLVALSQIVAEVLGLEPDEVSVIGGDTDLTPYDTGPGGSRGTVRVGNSTRLAAEDARRQLVALAASRLEANPEDLEVGRRQVYVRGTPERAISLAALARAAMIAPKGAIIGTGSSERENMLAKEEEHASVVDEASFCTHAAQVEVDPETGRVKVLKYVAAQDVGQALNLLSAVGQVQGAAVAGLGYALTEELVVQEGRIMNPGYVDYHMPAADITPPIHAILVSCPSSFGPFGARGVGETSIVPVAAVIANAIYDAVGVRVRDLPMTPEKVVRALKEKAAEAS
ncbi:MAG: xanthine dehydrogenase family protein molybdopterin-binding subunit [Chloroflexi bacterium]|nr:xanthine dehydrogenase family protein molybdopterin-binding subunit [Chloroflexota bacterium]